MVINGAGQYTEMFSAGSGNRYLTGFKGQINVKHDGSGGVFIAPASGDSPHSLRCYTIYCSAEGDG